MAKRNPDTDDLRSPSNPLEIWQSDDGEWEWRVLRKKSDLIWECAVKSPNTFGSWEYGDVYSQSVTQHQRTFVDLGIRPDYFADIIPMAVGTEIEVPDPSQPRVVLNQETFPFLCRYFQEDNMSFHVPNAQGEIVFFFNPPLEECPTVMGSNWGVKYGEEKAGRFHFDLLIYDQPDDPLTVPFSFNTSDEKHRYEMTQLVEQETLPFFALALHDGLLFFYDCLPLQLPDDLRRELAPIVRESLLRASVA